jgi:hypothetical protein
MDQYSPEKRFAVEKVAKQKAVDAFNEIIKNNGISNTDKCKHNVDEFNTSYIENAYKDSQGRMVEARLFFQSLPNKFSLFANRGDTIALSELKIELEKAGISIIHIGEHPTRK